MSFLRKKYRLVRFLAGRVPRHGFGQLTTGLRHRTLGYTAMELAGSLPPSLEVIVDVGGHHGDVSDALDFLYHPRRLWVVEPNPQLTASLQARFVGRSHIRVIPQCLGEKEGKVAFNVHEFDAASSLYECAPGHLEKFGFSGKRRQVEVPMTTLARLVASGELSHIDLLKLDCQGAELSVLRGAGAYLPRISWIYCELAFDPIYADAPLFGEVHRFLVESGFALHSFGNFAGANDSIQWADGLYRNTRPLS